MNDSEYRLLAYGTQTIRYTLSFAPRKTLAIRVHPDLSVEVVSPEGASLDDIETRLRRRAAWILRKQRQYERFLPYLPPRQFVSGETHRYLGRQYRLSVTQGEDSSVKLIGRFFEIVTLDKSDASAVQRLLDGWYRHHATRVFEERLEHCLESSWFRSLAMPKWTIRKMKRRWGSCTKDGAVLLNLLLIQVSPRCIDYVITHELCHLMVHNHGPEFYRLLNRAMPDWQERKHRLERQVL